MKKFVAICILTLFALLLSSCVRYLGPSVYEIKGDTSGAYAPGSYIQYNGAKYTYYMPEMGTWEVDNEGALVTVGSIKGFFSEDLRMFDKNGNSYFILSHFMFYVKEGVEFPRFNTEHIDKISFNGNVFTDKDTIKELMGLLSNGEGRKDGNEVGSIVVYNSAFNLKKEWTICKNSEGYWIQNIQLNVPQSEWPGSTKIPNELYERLCGIQSNGSSKI